MAKTRVERCLTLNINQLNRDSKGDSALRPGFIGSIDWSSGSKVSVFTTAVDSLLVLQMSFVKDGETVSQDIFVDYTDMPKGGNRAWFRCPVTKNGVPCGRRVGRLYLPSWGRFFACRHCYELAYGSQQEWANRKVKALLRSLVLEERLMRWNTGKKMTRQQYDQFMKTYDEYVSNLRKAGIIPNGYRFSE